MRRANKVDGWLGTPVCVATRLIEELGSKYLVA